MKLWIKELREQQGMTQKELAEKMQVSFQTISKWENGVNMPDITHIPRLAEGGYVKANTPQLAMIGDNKHQGEVVAPEDKMLEMILTALKLFKDQDPKDNPNQGQTITINFNGTMAQLVRVLKPELDRESNRKGNKLIIGGAT